MMLFYKAWRESQVRFLLTALALAGFCICTVVFRPELERALLPADRGRLYGEYIYNLIYSGDARSLFSLLVIFLGLGGLLRERSHNTPLFTLTLPVTRAQLVCAHVAVGLTELGVLALLPALILPPVSALMHQSLPVAEALRYSLLWFTCGTVIFATSFLLSVFLGGEYTAPTICVVLIYLDARIGGSAPFRPYHLNIMRTMAARWDWSARTSQIGEPLPWAVLSAIILVALGLFAIANRITQKQNF
jgi:ABC-2 type transport system permease protein